MSSEETGGTRPRSRSGDLIRMLRRALVFAAGDVVVRGPELVLLPLYAAFLSPSDFGRISIATTVTVILRPTLSLGLQAAALKFYFDVEGEDRRRFYGLLLAAYVAGTGLLYLLLDAAGPWLFGAVFASVEYEPLIRMAVWTAYLGAAFLELPRQILKASGKAGAYSALNVGLYLVITALTVIEVVVQHGGAIGAVRASLTGTAAVSLGCFVWLLRYVSLPKRADLALMAKALAFSVPMVPHFLSQWVLSSADRVILENVAPMSEVGLYTAGYTIGWSLSLLRVGMAHAMIPMYGNLDRRDTAGRERIAKLLTYYFGGIFAGAMVLTVFSAEILALVTPETYGGSADIIPWVVLGAVFFSVYNPSVQVLNFVVGRTRIIGLATVLSATTNIGLNLIFIPRYGMMGAALTTAATYFMLACGVFAIAQRACALPYEYVRIAKVAVACLIPTLILAIAVDPVAGPTGIVLKAGIICLSPPILIGLGFLDQGEKAAVVRRLKRVPWA